MFIPGVVKPRGPRQAGKDNGTKSAGDSPSEAGAISKEKKKRGQAEYQFQWGARFKELLNTIFFSSMGSFHPYL